MFGHNVGFSEWWCGPGAFFPGPLGMIVSLFFWGLIIYLAVWILQAIFKSKSQDGSAANGSRALDILKERYARGEIGNAEFEQMKTDLL